MLDRGDTGRDTVHVNMVVSNVLFEKYTRWLIEGKHLKTGVIVETIYNFDIQKHVSGSS